MKSNNDLLNEDGSPICIRCQNTVMLRDNTEHDGFCDSCAHDEIVKLCFALRELRDAVNPIIDPSVTTLTVDGTLDMINASRKADDILLIHKQ